MAGLPEDAKARLRREALTRRDRLDASIRQELSYSIADRAMAGPLREVARDAVVAGYVAMRSEADPAPLMAALAARGARLALPAVTGRALVFRDHAPGDPLERGAFGTLAPSRSAATVRPIVLLVPLAAFDRRGHRIGYGGGFYDRAIAAMRADGGSLATIGLAFAAQEIAMVPAEPFDEALDAVVTEAGVVAGRA